MGFGPHNGFYKFEFISNSSESGNSHFFNKQISSFF